MSCYILSGARGVATCKAVVREHVITIADIEASADDVMVAGGFLARVYRIKVLKTLVDRAHVQDSSRWKQYNHYVSDALYQFLGMEAAGEVADLGSQADVERAVVEQQGTASRALDISVATDSTSVP